MNTALTPITSTYDALKQQVEDLINFKNELLNLPSKVADIVIEIINYPVGLVNSIIDICKGIINPISAIAGPFAPIFIALIGGILGLVILKIIDFIIELL